MRTLKESLLDIDFNLENDDLKSMIEEWLKKYNIKNYTINDDYTINVNDSVCLDDYPDAELPSYIQFNNVNGAFYISQCPKLKTLRGCPKVIGLNFDCSDCKNLEYFDHNFETVGVNNRGLLGSFDCSNCIKLKSLEGSPRKLKGSFMCGKCISLKTLDGVPEKVDGNFSCSVCGGIKNLKGSPHTIGEKYCCNKCSKLVSLEGAPEVVGGNFDCSHCGNLISLEGAPEDVGGNFDCSHCGNLISLKGAPKEVGGYFIRN